ncbi:MAG: transglutaminase family protein [Candidatus Deferrimicrobiaceae bacterium]
MQPGGRVRIPGILWFSLRAHWASGLLPLVFLTDISRPALAVATAAFAVGAFLDWTGNLRRGWHRAASPLLAAGALATVADLFFGSGDLLLSISLLLLGVQSIKFLLPKTIGDGWQLCAISFLEFLAAAASTTEIQFAGFLFLFLGLSVGAMWALQTEESAEAGGAVPRAQPGFALSMLLLCALAGFLLTAVLFVVTPRIGIGQLLNRQGNRGGLTGFSDAISLRDVTSIKADRRVIARIEFPELAAWVSPSGLYLRGGTYARFDGTTWSRMKTGLARVPRTGLHYFLSPQPAIPLSSAEIYMEPTGHSALFVYPGAVTVEGALGEIRTDGGGNYHLSAGKSAVRYHLLFSPEGFPRKSRLSGPGSEYLALPPGANKIRELAGQVTSGARSDAERAELARRFFLGKFRYSLTDVASSVEEFLFRKRQGFCEHYAAGLTLLLRAAGIPARIAAGYLGGEWSDVGKYLIVRQSDAHAWTEGWIDGRWVTLDATPSLGEGNPFFSRTGRIGMYIDWTMQQWNKYVVNYSLRMQAQAVSGGWFALRRSGKRIRGTIRGMGGADIRVAAGLGLALAVILFVRRARGRVPSRYPRRPGEGEPPLPRPYARLLRRLSATRRRRSAGIPFEELLRESAERTPVLLPETARFLSLYHRERFGPCPLTAEESAEARRLADLLRRRLFLPKTP